MGEGKGKEEGEEGERGREGVVRGGDCLLFI